MSIFEQRKQAFENFEEDLIAQINLSKNDKRHIFHSVWGNNKNQSSKTIMGNVFKIMLDEQLKLENDNTYESPLKNLLSVFAIKYVNPEKVETAIQLTMELFETEAFVDIPDFIKWEAGVRLEQKRRSNSGRTNKLAELISSFVEKTPKITHPETVELLKKHCGNGVILSVDEDNESFEWEKKDGEIKDNTFGSIKDILSRIKRKNRKSG